MNSPCSIRPLTIRPSAAVVLSTVAWHIYGDPRDVSKMAKVMRDAFRPYNVTPSIWTTEANVPVNDPKAPADALVGPESVSLDEQAAFMIQLFALARASDVRAVAVYRAIDVDENRHYWGLFRSDWSPRPSVLAFQTAARWLSHAHYVSSDHPTATATVIHFQRGAQNIVVAWNDSAVKQSVDVSSDFNSGMLVSPDGVETPAYSRASAFPLSLRSATPHRPASAPLGLPVMLVTGSNY